MSHTSSLLQKEMTHGHWENHLCPAHGLLPVYEFQKCIQRYNGHYKVKHFSCWNQFSLHGLRSIDVSGKASETSKTCLRSTQRKLYHIGFRGNVSRILWLMPTRSEIGESMPTLPRSSWASPSPLRQRFLRNRIGIKPPMLWTPPPSICVSPFSRGQVPSPQRRCKIAYPARPPRKHSLPRHYYSWQGSRRQNSRSADLRTRSFYVIDRGYLDFDRLYAIHQTSAFFVIRAKSNFRFRRLYSRPVDKSDGVQSDQIIVLEGFYSHKAYPDKLRRIRYFDTDQTNG